MLGLVVCIWGREAWRPCAEPCSSPSQGCSAAGKPAWMGLRAPDWQWLTAEVAGWLQCKSNFSCFISASWVLSCNGEAGVIYWVNLHFSDVARATVMSESQLRWRVVQLPLTCVTPSLPPAWWSQHEGCTIRVPCQGQLLAWAHLTDCLLSLGAGCCWCLVCHVWPPCTELWDSCISSPHAPGGKDTRSLSSLLPFLPLWSDCQADLLSFLDAFSSVDNKCILSEKLCFPTNYWYCFAFLF